MNGANAVRAARASDRDAWRALRAGVGAALIHAGEAWGRARGAREIASDAAIDNAERLAAHRALGFEEVVRAVLFRRDLRA